MNENQINERISPKNTIWGFSTTDLLGIAVMIIPFIISIVFNYQVEAKKILFITIKPGKDINIRPGYVSSLLTVLFYASLIARYNIFRVNTLAEGIISSFRAFLNCWVLSSLIEPATPIKFPDSINTLFANKELTFLLFAVILSWLGMKTIAGYSWVIFILAALPNIIDLNNAMNMLGAVYIITTAISLFLQISNYTNMKNFLSDFRVGVSKNNNE